MKRTLVLLSLLLVIFRAEAGNEIQIKFHEAKLPKNDHFGYQADGSHLHFFSNGKAEWTVSAKRAGAYTLEVKASCTKGPDGFAQFQISTNGKTAGKPVSLKRESVDEYTVKLELKRGQNIIGLAFVNDAYAEGEHDRNLFVHGLKLSAK